MSTFARSFGNLALSLVQVWGHSWKGIGFGKLFSGGSQMSGLHLS